MRRTGRYTIVIMLVALVMGACSRDGAEPSYKKVSDETFPSPSIEHTPSRYICRKIEQPLRIDGRLDEDQWNDISVSWSDYFGDIMGPGGGDPRFRTRFKMVWDDEYLYLGAEMEEPHVRASVTGRDGDIYRDNAFELFIDPDSDTHEYYELDINAFGAYWDLLLVKPYRDGGPAVDAWDIQGLEKAVYVEGTLNEPFDEDGGWSVEIAIPWDVLGECAHRRVPPDEGDIWSMNFARLHWDVIVEDGRYVKNTDPETGKPFPPQKWSWTPQGIMNMHYPEMYGLVMFTNPIRVGGNSFNPAPVEQARWVLRKIYYEEKTHFLQYGRYTAEMERLGVRQSEIYGYLWPPRLEATSGTWEAVLGATDGTEEVRIDNTGRVVTREK